MSIAVDVYSCRCGFLVLYSYVILHCTVQLYDLVLYTSYMILYCTVQLYDLVLYGAVI